MEQKLLTIKNIKEVYGISRTTLINWEKKGLLSPIRTPGGQRRYRREDIEKILQLTDKEENEPKADTVIYARVSTKKQEEYLKNQIKRLEKFAKENGYKYEIISEIASGVNEKRRGLRKLLNKIKRGEVKTVIIEYPDRLARFGYEYLKFFMETFGVKLIVVNGKEETEDLNKELAEDLIAIVTSFSARIYGARGGKKK
ncbi:IS607 family transposase [Persephonella sp. KM09-Lau-8]|uniref:IS607 family transposase n=1 Tax=Persephonella sp. KM09-Lau-8 TaxID=1158345 RepID=UPI000496F07B